MPDVAIPKNVAVVRGFPRQCDHWLGMTRYFILPFSISMVLPSLVNRSDSQQVMNT